MSARVTFVGQAPGRATDPLQPLSERCGRFLAGILGETYEAFLRRDRRNLVNSWHGKAGKGDAFDAARAREAAPGLRHILRRHRVVLLGRKVARCFGARAGFLERERVAGMSCLVFPHPSGINRWWNDGKNRARARRALRRFAGLR